MAKTPNFKDQISEVHPFVTKVIEAFRHGYAVFAAGVFARDLILGLNTNTLELLILGNSPSIDEKIALLHDTVLSTQKNVFSILLDETVTAKITYHQVPKCSRSHNSIEESNAIEAYARDQHISTRAMLLLLTGPSTGKLFDPLTLFPLFQERQIAISRPIEQAFTAHPQIMPQIIYEAALCTFDLPASIVEHITNYAEKLAGTERKQLSELLINVLQLPVPSSALIPFFRLGLLKYIFPEMVKLAGVEQMKEYNHKDVFYHTCEVVDNIAMTTGNTWLRFVALTHDIAKPQTKRFVEGTGWTFHGHEELGARMIRGIFRRLELSAQHLEYVQKLVRLHLRPAALVSEGVSDSAIRRLITEAGSDLEDLLTLCRADITSKNPAKVARVLRNYDHVVERIREVREKDLAAAFQSPVRGEEIMRICDLRPSKTVGLIKDAIEAAILNNEIENTYEAAYEYLLKIKDRFLSAAK